ncbi:acetyltransferase, N-acetylglutamate synthase [Terriglobus roseus DSM 18391]|uniref:Acetyltransferase, N-acetylglutamate synthase n=1 Tax=Terriglobus roseus (strain DSM 18391 / NRRL B-41598 / KBS 63) TaxID=926566 RepID=I3ZIC0_TERRK|nr:GNAT family N-acetyltransferase [Terriglobus roseus]AFL88988.1 acetyltransferase, N-acetylglutamate synthase [Terriglobus roseus DSM 18391]
MTTTTIELTMRPMATAADAEAFRTLNEEWISKWFRIEAKDAATLGDPQGKIVATGGQVYVAVDGERVLGTAALIRFGDGIYELSKMAVAPETRGQGVGRRLLTYMLEQARDLGAHTVFLGSSTKLKNAVHLYESLGFRHVLPSELPEMKYDRADVFMKIDLI